MLSLTDLHWLAGLLEGEGNFRWTENKKSGRSRTSITGSPVIQLSMTDLDVIEKAHRLLGATGKIGTTQPTAKSGYVCKLAYRFTLCGHRAAAWMMTLYPLVGQRRRTQIRGTLEKWKAIPTRRLKGFGHSVKNPRRRDKQ